MRLRKNEQPLSIEEHEKIAATLNDFLKGLDLCKESIEKGFSETSPVYKKLRNMIEIGNFLKYSLQQTADMHRARNAEKSEQEMSEVDVARWRNVYLGSR